MSLRFKWEDGATRFVEIYAIRLFIQGSYRL